MIVGITITLFMAFFLLAALREDVSRDHRRQRGFSLSKRQRRQIKSWSLHSWSWGKRRWWKRQRRSYRSKILDMSKGTGGIPMKTTLTLGEIRRHNPCPDGWDKLTDALGTADPDTVVDLRTILDSNGPTDAWWATRCLPRRERVALGLIAAESVAHLSTDRRVSACRDTYRAWLLGDSTKEELQTDAVRAMGEAWEAANAAWAEHGQRLGDLMRRWCDEQEASR